MKWIDAELQLPALDRKVLFYYHPDSIKNRPIFKIDSIHVNKHMFVYEDGETVDVENTFWQSLPENLGNWIDMKLSIPGEYVEVFCIYKGAMEIAEVSIREEEGLVMWLDDGFISVADIDCWLPLPPCPEEDEDVVYDDMSLPDDGSKAKTVQAIIDSYLVQLEKTYGVKIHNRGMLLVKEDFD